MIVLLKEILGKGLQNVPCLGFLSVHTETRAPFDMN